MVRKIHNAEYLKRLDNMTAAERSEYLGRVGGWLSVNGQSLAKKGNASEAQLQNVLQVSVVWNDQECSAFEEGAVLLSALVGVADTKLPELLYAISAKRAIKRMFQLLWDAEARYCAEGKADGLVLNDAQRRSVPTDKHKENADSAGQEAAPVQSGMNNPKLGMQPQLFEDQTTGKPTSVHGAVPVRPKHFDQYAHLLPQKTQERIASYGELMRELDASREKLRLLMDDPTASAADRESWAKKVAKTDKEIGDIRREADAEWDKLARSGRVVIDDLGIARILPTDDGEPATENESDDAQGPSDLTVEQKVRRRSLRKWLTDTRNGNGDQREKHVQKWRNSFREYLSLEGSKAFEDEKIAAAARHYGIDTRKLEQDD